MCWIEIGKLDESDCDFADYNNCIGVYKATLNNDLVYIGKATEINNGGFRKRLRDYTRENDGARNYPGGRNMFSNKEYIIISIKITDTAEKAAELERNLIDRLNPTWNQQ